MSLFHYYTSTQETYSCNDSRRHAGRVKALGSCKAVLGDYHKQSRAQRHKDVSPYAGAFCPQFALISYQCAKEACNYQAYYQLKCE